MNKAQRKRLEDAGWKFGTVQDLLGLSDAEAQLIEIRLAVARKLVDVRLKRGVTQKALAKTIGSSQPRVAKIEAGDPSVSLDLLVKASLAAGATRKELAKVIASPSQSSRRSTSLRNR
jgi:predicted transcriptional regulator